MVYNTLQFVNLNVNVEITQSESKNQFTENLYAFISNFDFA